MEILKKDIRQDKISSQDNLSHTIITGMETGMKENLIKEETEIVLEKEIFTIKAAKMVIKVDKEVSKEVKMISKESLMEMVRIDMVERMTISLNLAISQAIISLKSRANLNNTITDFYKNYFLRFIIALQNINSIYNPSKFIFDVIKFIKFSYYIINFNKCRKKDRKLNLIIS